MFFVFLLLTDEFVPSQIQEKAEIFARGFLGEADAGNLHSGEGDVPGRGEGEVSLQGEDAGGKQMMRRRPARCDGREPSDDDFSFFFIL